MRALALVAAALLVSCAVAACSSRTQNAGTANLDVPDDGGAGDAGEDAGDSGLGAGDAMPPKPSPDAGCGYEAIDVSRTLPNVYFVIDRSGSMGGVVGGKKKIDVVRGAAVSLARAIGWRANLGAAIYPKTSVGDHYCEAGAQVMALQPGDPKSFLDSGQIGPVAQKLTIALEVAPFGNTPTAATLAALTPTLASFGKGTYVILATDGGPNCSEQACGVEACIPNIEGVAGCSDTVNCCDPSMSKFGTPELCVDANGALSAVSSLAAAGVTVVVVGISGSAYYQGLLDALAVAGGAPRPTSPRYYRVDDLGELEGTFASIGSEVILSCDFALAGPPPEQNNVNVYLDDTLIYFDEKDGWTYSGPSTITLHGKACSDLEAGKYQSAQVFLGCPTMMPPLN